MTREPVMFKSVQEKAAPHKTAAACPLIFNLTYYPRKINKIYHALVSSCDIVLWTSTHGHTSVGRAAKIYLYYICKDTGPCLKNLPGVMANWDG